MHQGPDLVNDSEKFEPKLTVPKENVEHHAEDEEKGKMFPKVHGAAAYRCYEYQADDR